VEGRIEMPVIVRTRRKFRGQIRAHINRVYEDLKRWTRYNSSHPTKNMLSAGDLVNVTAVAAIAVLLLSETEPA
jgi:hypothetical protein